MFWSVHRWLGQSQRREDIRSVSPPRQSLWGGQATRFIDALGVTSADQTIKSQCRFPSPSSFVSTICAKNLVTSADQTIKSQCSFPSPSSFVSTICAKKSCDRRWPDHQVSMQIFSLFRLAFLALKVLLGYLRPLITIHPIHQSVRPSQSLQII